MPANPPLLALAMLLGLCAGFLLAAAHRPAPAGSPPSDTPGEKLTAEQRKERDARSSRGAVFFGLALLIGMAGFILGFLGWEGNAALSNAPIGERQGALSSLNSRGLMYVAGTYVLGYILTRTGFVLFGRRMGPNG
ncbi:hypothetical protein IT575_05440 [bacterium]|nr:hypothetical protein [bacterium]